MGGGTVQRIFASCFMFANEVLAGSLCEWNCVFGASCIYDGAISLAILGWTWAALYATKCGNLMVTILIHAM